MVERVLADYRTAPIGEAERALLEFVDKVNSAAHRIEPADVEAAKRAGWSEEALYDAITVCSLFNFYNRWCDASGVHPLPLDGFRLVAGNIASSGYSHRL